MKVKIFASKKFIDSAAVRFQDITKVHPSLKHYFGYCLFKVASKQKSLIDQEITKIGLQTPHLGILVILWKEGPVSQIKLGDSIGVDKASMVKLVDALEDQKLIMRQDDPNDRRVNLLTITSMGKKKITQAKKIVEDVEKKFLHCLSLTEQENLKAYLAKLVSY